MTEYTAEYSVFVNTSWIWLSPKHVCHGRRPATMQAPPTSRRRRSTPAEKWDTDSDSSDGSGDELDLAV